MARGTGSRNSRSPVSTYSRSRVRITPWDSPPLIAGGSNFRAQTGCISKSYCWAQAGCGLGHLSQPA